ncbi:hypothetical protein AAMO2058_000664800 [Amorphochlora amoebiformis]
MVPLVETEAKESERRKNSTVAFGILIFQKKFTERIGRRAKRAGKTRDRRIGALPTSMLTTKRKSASAYGSLTSSRIICLNLNSQGTIVGFTPNAKIAFHTSMLMGTNILKLLSGEKPEGVKNYQNLEFVEERVTFYGRDKGTFDGELIIRRLRNGHKADAGFSVLIKPEIYDEDDGIDWDLLPEGYLEKKASLSNNKWQGRYFRARKILHPDRPAEFVLDYFTDAETLVSRGSIRLQGARVMVNYQPLVFSICSENRDMYLKCSNPKSRWQWAVKLQVLSKYESLEEAKKEILDVKKISDQLDSRTGMKNEKKSWRDSIGRTGGAEGFQISDIARLAKSRFAAGKRSQSQSFGIEVLSGKYLSFQVISGRNLKMGQKNVGNSANLMAKIFLKGPTDFKQELANSEIGYGPDPTFASYEPELAKERKLYNLLTGMKLREHTELSDYELVIRIVELGMFGQNELGECLFQLNDCQPNKLSDKWVSLRPPEKFRGPEKSRGDIKVSIYYEDEQKQKKHHRKMSSLMISPTAGVSGDPFEGKFNDDPFKSPARKMPNIFEDAFDEEDKKIPEPQPSDDATEIKTLKGELKSLQQQLEDAQTKAAEDASDRKALIKSLEEKLLKARESIKKSDTEKAKAQTGKKKAEAEMVRRLTAAKRLYDRELKGRKQAEGKLTKLRSEITSFGAQNAEKEAAAIKVLKDEIKDMKAKLLDVTNERDTAGVEASKKITEAEEKITELQQKIKDLSGGADLSAEKIKSLTGELSSAQSKIKSLEGNKKTLEDEMKGLSDVLEKLKLSTKDQVERMVQDYETKLQTGSEASAELERSANSMKIRMQQLETAATKGGNLLKEAQLKAQKSEERAVAAETRVKELSKFEARLKALEAIYEADRNAAEEAAKANASVSRALRVQFAMYARYLNTVLGGSPLLKKYDVLPLSEEESTWAGPKGIVRKLVSDGLLVAGYLNFSVPNTLDERALHVSVDGSPLSEKNRKENLELVAQTCKSIGVAMGRPGDLVQLLMEAVARPREAAEFLFALISFHELRRVRLERVPEIKEGVAENRLEEIAASPIALLSSWVPFHVSAYVKASTDANTLPEGVSDINADSKTISHSWSDLQIPALLISGVVHRAGALVSVRNGVKSSELGRDILRFPAGGARLQAISDQLKLLGAAYAGLNQGYMDDLIKATWMQANILFAGIVLDASAGLVHATDEKNLNQKNAELAATVVWLNNLGLDKLPRVHDLFAANRDGLLLLRVLDFMSPGCINWRKAELKPNHKIKRISNCSLAVDTGKKEPFEFSLVGVGGSDIYEGNKKLTLSLMWQMRRYQLLNFLEKVFANQRTETQEGHLGPGVMVGRKRGSSFSRKARFDESSIINWANRIITTALKARGAPEGSERLFREGKVAPEDWTISSLKDESLTTSIFYMLLLWASAAWSVNWRFVTPGDSEEQRVLNARYAITVARKQGASVFVLPEDLLEIKPKMVLVFLGALLTLHGSGKKQ